MIQDQFFNLKIMFKLIDKNDKKRVSNERKKKAENLSISLERFQSFIKVLFNVVFLDSVLHKVWVSVYDFFLQENFLSDDSKILKTRVVPVFSSNSFVPSILFDSMFNMLEIMLLVCGAG